MVSTTKRLLCHSLPLLPSIYDGQELPLAGLQFHMILVGIRLRSHAVGPFPQLTIDDIEVIRFTYGFYPSHIRGLISRRGVSDLLWFTTTMVPVYSLPLYARLLVSLRRVIVVA